MRYSVVIPVLDEAESVDELHASLSRVVDGLDGDVEILFVDDGSTDGTGARLDELARRDGRVTVLHFSRNHGKSAAYRAGFDAATGDILLTLDGDLQDDPAELPRLLDRLQAGHDLVVGWKQGRFENEPAKKVSSATFNRLLRLVFGVDIHDSNCGMRAMRIEVARDLSLYGDLYRFIPQLAALRGFRVTEEPIVHRPRLHSHSKYGPSRLWTGALDVLTVRFLTTWREKPLHFFGTLAIAPILLGGALEGYVLLQKLQGSLFRTHMAAMVTGILFILIGVQLLATGLIGEMLSAQLRERGTRARVVGPRSSTGSRGEE